MNLFGRIIRSIFGPKEPDPVALVLLLRSPRELPELIVRQAIEAGTECAVDPDSISSQPFKYEWVSNGWRISFLTIPTRYLPARRENKREARLGQAIEAHTAAILIDVWEAPPNVDRVCDGINLIGKMAIPLIDSDVTAIYCFNTQRANLVDEELATALRDGRAFEIMSTMNFDPVITQYSHKKMDSAIAEAKRRFPEFEAAFHSRTTQGDPFLVKLPFGEENSVEHMWVSVSAIEGGEIIGTLENKPMRQPGLKQGSTVTRPASDISDWIFKDGESVVGGFTTDALSD
jgi:uncharacterized protein YegJ (DUF2314 family)